MKTTAVKMSDSTARELYKSTPSMRKALEESFGEKFFSMDICDRINTIDDFFTETGRPKIDRIEDLPEDLHELFLSIYTRFVGCEAYNEGVKPNYKDTNEKKWYPIYSVSSGGLAFRYADCDYSIALSGDASRHALREKRLAEDWAKKFSKLDEKILNL